MKSLKGKSWASIAQLVKCLSSMTVTCVDVHATPELRRWRQQGQKVKVTLLSILEGCMTLLSKEKGRTGKGGQAVEVVLGS